LFAGEAARALEAFALLHHDGAEPVQLLTDLAEAVHATARCKIVGEAGSEALSKEELRRAGTLAERLSIPLLARAWQMLVKGLEDVTRSPSPATAAEMVLIRIAYAADLPSPDEVIKALGGGSVAVRSGGRRAGAQREQDAPLEASAGTPALPVASDDGLPVDDAERWEAREDDPFALEELGLEDGAHPMVSSFADVVTLAGAKRDAKLKVHLEEHVSLVKFDAAAGSIDVFLMPGAPHEIANELREKLNRWTGRRWVVMLSKVMGEPPIGVARRERQAAEIEALKAEPAVRGLLDAFPDAKIADVRPMTGGREDDTATG
jgi:DNA polymerase-3 subunit gamma/tau